MTTVRDALDQRSGALTHVRPLAAVNVQQTQSRRCIGGAPDSGYMHEIRKGPVRTCPELGSGSATSRLMAMTVPESRSCK